MATIFCSVSGIARQYDLRERCKRDLGGILLDALNDKNYYDNQLVALTRTSKRLTNRLKNLEKKYAEYLQESDADRYRFDLEERKLESQYQIANTREHLDQSRRILNESKDKRIKAQKKHQSLSDAIRKIFLIKENNGVIRLRYHQGCPEFDYMCPLSPDKATILASLLPPEELPKACARYAQVLPRIKKKSVIQDFPD